MSAMFGGGTTHSPLFFGLREGGKIRALLNWTWFCFGWVSWVIGSFDWLVCLTKLIQLIDLSKQVTVESASKCLKC
jgi:hypothetical protein